MIDEQLYGLGERDVARLQNLLRAYEAGELRGLLQPPTPPSIGPVVFQIGKAISDIAPGTNGLVQLWRGPAGSETQTTSQVVAYDWLGAGCAANAKLHLWRHTPNGKIYFAASPQSQQLPAEVIEFQTTEAMGATTANYVAVNVTASFRGAAPTPPVVVWGGNQIVDCLSGAYGMATWDDSQGRYTIINCETQAKFIRFALAGTLTTSDASSASATVSDYWHGQDPGSTATVYNAPASGGGYRFEGSSGAIGEAVWDEWADKYWIIQLEQDCD